MIVDSPVEEVKRNINKYGKLFAKNSILYFSMLEN